VKDEKRFARKWAFFGFQGDATKSEERAADSSSCYTCHEPNGAVDTTFVQFYPTLVSKAKEKGTYQSR
jgi:cytochrome c553